MSDTGVEFQITGTGLLGGFSQVITIPLQWESHSGPRSPGDPVQSFPTEMIGMQGQIFGDPDFCVLNLRAGSGFGLPSPGQTLLTDLPTPDWNVDSFFDLTYEVDFQGCPGSVIEGFGGTSAGSLRILTGATPAPEPGVLAMLIAGSAYLVLLGRR